MTTYIADSAAAACDSLWSNPDGEPTDVMIKKYLFLDGGMLQGQLTDAKIILYSGQYELLLNHQASLLGIISKDQYDINAHNLEQLGCTSLSYIEIELGYLDWEVVPFNAEYDSGVFFGGTGGRLAFHRYRELYDVKLAVDYAIEHDPYSGLGVNIIRNADNGLYYDGFDAVDEQMYTSVKAQISELILSFQSGELGGGKKMKYAGCTTSPALEAKPVTAKELIEFEEKRRKERMFRSKEGRVKRPIRRLAMS